MSTHSLDSRGIANFDLYPYVPSAAAGWTFVVLFGIVAVVHLAFMITLRSWFFIPFILGCIGEAGGYYGRAWSHQNIRNGTPYLIQMMLTLGSAPLLAGTVYMTLGRFIRGLDAEEHAPISSRKITKPYVFIDVASFVCQIFGSAAQASGAEGARKGMLIVVGGLGIQLFAFVCFIGMGTIFHRKLNREPTATSSRPHVNWRRHMWTLYAVSTLILVRTIFRFIEFAVGADGSLYKTEALIYVFDASLLFATTVCLALVHPGMLLRSIRKADVMPLSDNDKSVVPLNQYGE
ncbi:RTA1-domain-containing protein [Zopfia rhizophila CBS 207.26]|uniref:RTA1-domain-containing protein n=1 Tax=Zopfia rhizophila CBS 207.26 TaxID=1314779 RepID=A0A6A6E013_9PEZI|nr:RTA1-domain-containing protein [Zopfia rhizophila CBS 207.26]